jgi:hypothetical protein
VSVVFWLAGEVKHLLLRLSLDGHGRSSGRARTRK